MVAPLCFSLQALAPFATLHAISFIRDSSWTFVDAGKTRLMGLGPLESARVFGKSTFASRAVNFYNALHASSSLEESRWTFIIKMSSRNLRNPLPQPPRHQRRSQEIRCSWGCFGLFDAGKLNQNYLPRIASLRRHLSRILSYMIPPLEETHMQYRIL